MIRGIEQHETPYAILVFQDIDACIILFDLPEMTHIETEKVTDDGLIDGIMGCDENRFAVVFPGIVGEGTAGAAPYIVQIFAASTRHGHFFRLCVPEMECFGILGFDFISQPAFPVSVIDFQQPVIFGNGEMMKFSTERSGLIRPFQRTGNTQVDGNMAQSFGQHVSLL